MWKDFKSFKIAICLLNTGENTAKVRRKRRRRRMR